MKNYYDVLGVDRDASTEEIRMAYKILVKKFHPDVNPEQRDFFEKKSKELNEAYETLSNSSKRASYDIRLDDFLSNRNTNQQNKQKEDEKRKQEEEDLKNKQEEEKQEKFEQERQARAAKETNFKNTQNKQKEQDTREGYKAIFGFLKKAVYVFLIIAGLGLTGLGGYVLYRYNVKYDKAYSFYQDLARVEKHEMFNTNRKKYGFVDRNDNIVIRIMYDDARDFNDGLAAVKSYNDNFNSRWGFVDKTGNMVISQKYDYVSDFSEGLSVVKCNYKWGFIDKKGKQVIGCKYTIANSFKEGYAWVSTKSYNSVYELKDEDYFLINKEGQSKSRANARKKIVLV